MKTLLGICSTGRLFETHKSEGNAIFVFNTNLFDLSVLPKKVYDVLFCITIREIFNIQIKTFL